MSAGSNNQALLMPTNNNNDKSGLNTVIAINARVYNPVVIDSLGTMNS